MGVALLWARGDLVLRVCVSPLFHYSIFWIVVVLISSRVFAIASPAPIHPAWTKETLSGQNPNASFLSDYKKAQESLGLSISEEIFSPSYASQKQKEFESILHNFEYREHYDLIDVDGRKAHFEALSAFSRNAMQETGRFHLNQKMSQFRNGLVKSFKEDPTFQSIRRPVEVIAAVSAFSLGVPMQFKPIFGTEFLIRTEVLEKKGELKITSPIFNTAINYFGKAPVDRNPFGPEPQDEFQKEERCRIAVSRAIPILDVETALSYGTTTTTITTSVSKKLHPSLTCVVDTSRVLKYIPTSGIRQQETVRLLYGLHF